jgi:hypothetical protein
MVCELTGGKVFGKRASDIWRNFSSAQFFHESLDANAQFAAANSVNVIAAKFLGSTPCANRKATRPAMIDVFPDPAPASTKKEWPKLPFWNNNRRVLIFLVPTIVKFPKAPLGRFIDANWKDYQHVSFNFQTKKVSKAAEAHCTE